MPRSQAYSGVLTLLPDSWLCFKPPSLGSPQTNRSQKLREQVEEVSKLCRAADPITLPPEVKIMIFEGLTLAEIW
jgi:hypothetical protein